MKFAMFIHNDDAKCFHVDVQGTHKLVVMGHINFEDHALIKRQWASKKMIMMGGKFKDEKKLSKVVCVCCWKLCAFSKF
jgi:hypothetical protein